MEGLKPRGYQLEMIELSLQTNMVVAIPTGGGKTLIAAKSIEAELDRSGAGKRVWFLCPTVVLANQQLIELSRNLPSVYETRILTGENNVDRWSSRDIWQRVLLNVSLVVCTYQVLCDALESGFVQLKEISLLVFDEAHVCNRKHPGNRIMQGFYHPAKKNEQEVPRVLGLTASLVGSDLGSLEGIETNLDAICRTPKASHDEMLSHVHMPSLVPLVYPPFQDAPRSIYDQLDKARLSLLAAGEADPYVVYLRSKVAGATDIATTIKLEKALEKGKTWSMEQTKRLWAVAQETQLELGHWCLHAYITKCLNKLYQLKPNPMLGEDPLREREIAYLKKAFKSIEGDGRGPDISETSQHSPKVNVLINALVDEMQPGITGILFVKTRAAVKLLADLLSTHPTTRDILRIGTFVGASSNQKGSQHISELIDGRGQGKTLDELRSGEKNLVIATSVVEEGIDISACNFVTCFDPPSNLRSFIQRRGRARKEQSKYIIMFPEKSKNKVKNWQEAEEEMKKMYQDDMRQLQGLEKLESEDTGYREFVVESTGAKLTLRNAVTRLHHFCSRIPPNSYSSREPVYTYSAENGTDRVKCEIHLPNDIHYSVRRHLSHESWRSERLARMDAAFEAVLALHSAELLDDHLVPLDWPYDESLANAEAIEKRPGIVEVDQHIDIWPEVAERWAKSDDLFTCVVTASTQDGKLDRLKLVSSRPFINAANLTLHVNRDSTVRLRFDIEDGHFKDMTIATANKVTLLLLRAGLRNRVESDRLGFPILCMPVGSLKDASAWLEKMTGSIPGAKLLDLDDSEIGSVGVIREIALSFNAYVLDGIEEVPRSSDEEGKVKKRETKLRVRKLSRRTDFLHTLPSDTEDPSKKPIYLRPNACLADRLPAKWAQISKFIPTLYHYTSIHWLADDLRTSLLKEAFPKQEHVTLLLTAISTSRARGPTDYQRLEFLGDTLLKFYVTLGLVTNHPLWHEGYLSCAKERMVSNANLAAVAERLRLGRYILDIPFTGAKWRPSYNDDLLQTHSSSPTVEETKRKMATKVLADVVEALLGAAWLAGGEESLLSCLRVFFPKFEWLPSNSSLEIVRSRTPHVPVSEPYISRLTTLVGHSFQNPAILLEAMTHPGYNSASTPSYQRMEFLGDALLDLFVVLRIWFNPVELSEKWMHRIRTATVNGPILCIAALSHHVEIKTTKPVETDDFQPDDDMKPNNKNGAPALEEETSSKSLVSFLRASHTLGTRHALEDLWKRYRVWAPEIMKRLDKGKVYPWTELAAFNPPKFVSDIVESVAAALVIDNGSLELGQDSNKMSAATRFLSKLGLFSHLQRMLDDAETTSSGGPLNVWHPMEEIGSLADQQTVRYEISKQTSVDADSAPASDSTLSSRAQSHSGSMRTCVILIGDRKLCEATGYTENEVRTRAAEKGVAILRRERGRSAGRNESELETHATDTGAAILRAEQGPSDVKKRKRSDAAETLENEDSIIRDSGPPLLPSSSSSSGVASRKSSSSSAAKRSSSALPGTPTKKFKAFHIEGEDADVRDAGADEMLERVGGQGRL